MSIALRHKISGHHRTENASPKQLPCKRGHIDDCVWSERRRAIIQRILKNNQPYSGSCRRETLTREDQAAFSIRIIDLHGFPVYSVYAGRWSSITPEILIHEDYVLTYHQVYWHSDQACSQLVAPGQQDSPCDTCWKTGLIRMSEQRTGVSASQ